MVQAKFCISREWKEFNISLPKVEEWMKANAGEFYCGNSAHNKLDFWFTEEPTQEVKDAVDAYWLGITAESAEATSYINAETVTNAIQLAKEDALTKSWDQLSAAQKKLIMGISPTLQELGL